MPVTNLNCYYYMLLHNDYLDIYIYIYIYICYNQFSVNYLFTSYFVKTCVYPTYALDIFVILLLLLLSDLCTSTWVIVEVFLTCRDNYP